MAFTRTSLGSLRRQPARDQQRPRLHLGRAACRRRAGDLWARRRSADLRRRPQPAPRAAPRGLRRAGRALRPRRPTAPGSIDHLLVRGLESPRRRAWPPQRREVEEGRPRDPPLRPRPGRGALRAPRAIARPGLARPSGNEIVRSESTTDQLEDDKRRSRRERARRRVAKKSSRRVKSSARRARPLEQQRLDRRSTRAWRRSASARAQRHPFARAHPGGRRRLVKRGRMTRDDANELVSDLVSRSRKQTDDLLKDLEKLLEQARKEAPARPRSAPGPQAGRPGVPAERPRRRRPALAQADRLRRRAGRAAPFPITAYDQLTAAQIKKRLGGPEPGRAAQGPRLREANGNAQGLISARSRRSSAVAPRSAGVSR